MIAPLEAFLLRCGVGEFVALVFPSNEMVPEMEWCLTNAEKGVSNC